MLLSEDEKNLIRDAIKAKNNFDELEFYHATDQFRWGHEDPTNMQLAIAKLEKIVYAYLVMNDTKKEIIDLIIKHINILEFCKELIGENKNAN